MRRNTREEVLLALETGWATYVERCQALSPEALDAFLHQQGYARFADLLAHLIAWWDEGLQAVDGLIHDPHFAFKEYDIDAFNARAVESMRSMPESAVIEAFEEKRRALHHLAASLPAQAWDNPNLASRLEIEVVGHLKEHNL